LLKNLDVIVNPNPQFINSFQGQHARVTDMNTIINNQFDVRDRVFRPNNLPVMTLDEFAEKEKAKMDEQKQMEEDAKANKPSEDSDDENIAYMKTYKATEWDDWKDINEKGSGNKMRK
jgi:hypothetical protein